MGCDRRHPPLQMDACSARPCSGMVPADWLMCFVTSNLYRNVYSLAASALAIVLMHQPMAEPPTLEHLSPTGASRGEAITMRSIGKVDPWPPKVWLSGPGIHFTPSEQKGEWKVQVAEDATPGARMLRLFNASGASAPRHFIVSQTPGRIEKEPNGTIEEATPVSNLPCIAQGSLSQTQDVDTFKLHLNQGQTLVARLDAYVLGSSTDALLRLLDTENKVLDWNHDSYYLDPMIAFTAPKTGYYGIQVMGFPYPGTSSERLGSGSGYIYRLFLTHAPYLRSIDLPSKENAGHGRMELNGWNLNWTGSVNHASRSLLDSMELATHRQAQLVSALGVQAEQEPNDQRDQANALAENGRGTIGLANDVDWYAFRAARGRWYRIEIQSARLGHPCDLVLKLFDAKGKELQSDDDSATMGDPRLEWKAPADGKFFLQVSSLTHQGGSDHAYRLIRDTIPPDCRLTLESSEFDLKPGGTTEIKVKIERRFGHTAKLILQAFPLPAGVACAPVRAEKEKKEITLFLHASPSANPFQGPFEVIAHEKEQLNQIYSAGKPTVTTSVNNGVPSGYMDQVFRRIETLWLTLLPRPQTDTEPQLSGQKKEP